MALKFSRFDQIFVPKWKGNRELPEMEQIQVSYRTMTVEDVFSVQRETKVNLLGGMDLNLSQVGAWDKYWELIKFVIEKYTSTWQNIEVDGRALTESKEITSDIKAIGLNLLAEVFQQVVSASMGTEEDEKNLSAEPVPVNSGSALIANLVSSPDSNGRETVEMGI